MKTTKTKNYDGIETLICLIVGFALAVAAATGAL